MIAKYTPLLLAIFVALPAAYAQQKRIAVTMIVEVPQLLDVKRGLLEELARLGLREGQNLVVDYSHAAGSFPTQQQIAKKIIGDKPPDRSDHHALGDRDGAGRQGFQHSDRVFHRH